LLASAGAVVGIAVPAASGANPGAKTAAPRIARVVFIPEIPLAGGVRLGGLSDLSPARGTPVSGGFWTLTDRGPNGTTEIGGRTLRTITAPGFTPTLALVRIPADAERGDAAIVRTLPLVSRAGTPLSGRPLPGLPDDPIVDPQARDAVAADADGIDSEAVVEMADGTFWIAEEYGPSLLHVSSAGRVLARFFPAGAAPAESGAAARDTLPADYARRRENRGFEALAAADDGTRLFALLQSPLDNPRPKAAQKTGNVRLLVFDPEAGRPLAEHVYRLGDPEDAEFLSRGAPPDDGKLCAMAAIDAATLLVLEQADGGLARLYAVTLEAATDTLRTRATAAADGMTLEQVRDLADAGIKPVEKRLVANIAGLLPEIEAAVYGGPSPAGKPRQLKLEGLTILDARTIVIVNDNDFGVHVRKGGAVPRSCLFVIELATPLPGGVAVPPRAAQNADE
jgi:hypothetical protein